MGEMVGGVRERIAKDDPTPGDVARFALHMDHKIFATRVAQWCGDDIELRGIAVWFHSVGDDLLHIRDSL